jgi:hypothetical protein
MADVGNFTKTPRHGVASIATANTNRDGSGTLNTVFTAGSTAGSEIFRVVVQATGTTSAGMVRLYVHDGTSAHLYRELPVTAISASGSTAAFRSDVLTPDLRLPTSGYELRASTNNAEPFKVHAHGGDY